MYTQQEIQQQYREATGNSLRPDTAQSIEGYFRKAFDQIDALTLELTSEVRRG
jgi:hypothetical protein